tara:strand:+ start:152 stop:1069 length:918 start_codon:yes stop_codon:yes gene_type:complete
MVEAERRFGIQPFGQAVELNLEEHEYRRIGTAKRFLLDVLRFEENYLLVLKAYYELERNSNDETLSSLLFREHSYDHRQNSLLQKDLKALAFLAAFRSYKDRLPKFNGQSRPGSVYSKSGNLWDEALLASPEFWACDRLRNFAIHRGSSVRFMASGGRWDQTREHSEAYTHFNFSVVELKDYLLERGEKADFCTNLREDYGERVNVFIVFRKALSKLGGIHNGVRGLLSEEYQTCDKAYREAVDKIESLVPGCRTGSAVAVVADQVADEIALFDELPDRAARLARRAVLENVEKHYITSRLDHGN